MPRLPSTRSHRLAGLRQAVLAVDQPALVQAGLLVMLLLLTLPLVVYVLIRMTSPAAIAYNEGWNTYHTARWLAGEPLYPPIQPHLPIIPVNYPPASFLVTAALSPLFGSILIAGRVISLVALLSISGLILTIVYHETHQWWASIAAGVLWVGLMVHLAPQWTASHEPQLLGHIFSTLALYLSVRWRPDVTAGRAVILALLCVLGLTVKHILVAVPLTLALALLVANRRAFWIFAATGLVASAAFLAAWWVWTDGIFMANVIEFDRQVTLERLTRQVADVMLLAGPLLLPALVMPWRGKGRGWAIIYLALSLGLGVYWSQGSGVSRNAWFDLFMAQALVFGLLLGSLRSLPRARRRLAYASAILALVPLAGNIWYDGRGMLNYATPGLEAAVYVEDVDLLRAMHGPALYEDILLGYDAGKDFLVDPFLATQLIAAGRLPEATLVQPIRDGQFKAIVFNPDTRRRLQLLDLDAQPDTRPQTTVAERWTNNTLRAIAEHYEPLDTGRRSHYFYVPRRR